MNLTAKPTPHYPGINRSHPLAQDLLALWPMWEGAGTRIGDIVQQRDGLFTDGSTTKWAGSKYGFVLTQSTNTDRVPHDSLPLDNLTSYTILAVVRTPDTSGNQVIACERDPTPIRYQFDLSSNSLRMIVRDDASNIALSSWAGALTAGEWAAVAGRRMGGTVDSFVNGVVGTSDTDTFGAIAQHDPAIGNLHLSAGNAGWLGDIAMVAIVGRALSDAEIAAWSDDPFSLFRIDMVRHIAILAPQVVGGVTMPKFYHHYQRNTG